MRVIIPQKAMELLRISEAVEHCATYSPDLLPKDQYGSVLLNNRDELADILRAKMLDGLQVEQPETLLAPKAARGRRPLSVLSFWERAAYRALEQSLTERIPALDRGSGKYDEFKRAPLREDGVRFVVFSDISNCYQYIDHGLLRDELLAKSGDYELTSALIDLLHTVTGKEFGLPQNNYSSDILSELVLGRIERSLLRSGIKVWRYNDDFRIGTRTRVEAHTALELLDELARNQGLALNEEKTSIRTRQRYADWVDAYKTQWSKVVDELDDDDLLEDYQEQTTTAQRLSKQAAVRVLQEWQDDKRQQRNQYGVEAAVSRNMAASALRRLGELDSTEGLIFCKQLLGEEPAITVRVAEYLAIVMDRHEAAVHELYETLVADEVMYLSDWQCLWLFQPLSASANPADPETEWLHSKLNSRSALTRAEACRILAAVGRLEMEEALGLFGEATEASKPSLVTAVATVATTMADPRLEAVAGESPLFRHIADRCFSPSNL